MREKTRQFLFKNYWNNPPILLKSKMDWPNYLLGSMISGLADRAEPDCFGVPSRQSYEEAERIATQFMKERGILTLPWDLE